MEITQQGTVRYPAGWYCFAPAGKITQGKIHSFNFFGSAFVCVRNSNNEVHVFDAYCPHMGAHLGVGGKIAGDQIICPFHGWKYNSAGECVDIPYCDVIPKRARLQRFQIRELNSFIYIYYDPGLDCMNAAAAIPAFLADKHFNVLFSRQIRSHSLQKIIAMAASTFDFHACGPGFMLKQADDYHCLISSTPVNNELFQVSFSYAQTKNINPLYALIRKAKQRQNFQLLLNEAAI